MENIKNELIRRQLMILTEPDGIIRETMINNLIDGLFEHSRLDNLIGYKTIEKEIDLSKQIPFMNYTNRQREVIQRLENLVHRRYKISELNEYLSEHFYEEIEVNEATINKDDCDTSDFNLIFESLEKDTYGYFDIYYLPTREENVILITEVGYQFENLEN